MVMGEDLAIMVLVAEGESSETRTTETTEGTHPFIGPIGITHFTHHDLMVLEELEGAAGPGGEGPRDHGPSSETRREPIGPVGIIVLTARACDSEH